MNDNLSEKQILSCLGKTDINYRLHIYDSVQSTNELAKKMIYIGDAAAGSVVLLIHRLLGTAGSDGVFLHRLAESISVSYLQENRYYTKKHFFYLRRALLYV